jgi:hypothetical protein
LHSFEGENVSNNYDASLSAHENINYSHQSFYIYLFVLQRPASIVKLAAPHATTDAFHHLHTLPLAYEYRLEAVAFIRGGKCE